MILSSPFCERCSVWVDETVTIGPLELPENIGEIKEQLEQGDFRSLEQLVYAEGEPDLFLTLELLQCPECRKSCYMTLKVIEITIDSEGETDTNETDLVENLVLTPENLNLIRERLAPQADG